jgi:hypothetical protein
MSETINEPESPSEPYTSTRSQKIERRARIQEVREEIPSAYSITKRTRSRSWCTANKVPEQALDNAFEHIDLDSYQYAVLRDRYLLVLVEFRVRAYRLMVFFYVSRIVITVGSILVPALLSIQYIQNTTPWVSAEVFQIQIYWSTWVISLLVSICNALSTLFKLEKKYYFINTTLELLLSEGWQYVSLSGRYASKESQTTHQSQFLVFVQTAEKIKLRQVEEEYWKVTDESGVGSSANHKMNVLTTASPWQQVGALSSLSNEKKTIIDSWVQDMSKPGLKPRTQSPTTLDGIQGPNQFQGATQVQRSTGETSVPVQSNVSDESPGSPTVLRIT